MSKNTETNIMDAFEKLLDETTISKVSVTEICNMAKIGRNTFYYHYDDVYAVLEAITERWISKYEVPEADETWQDALTALLFGLRANKEKVYNLFKYMSLTQLEQRAFKRTSVRIEEAIRKKGEKKGASSENVNMTIEAVEYTIYGYFIKFMMGGMKSDIEKDVKKLDVIFEEITDSMLK